MSDRFDFIVDIWELLVALYVLLAVFVLVIVGFAGTIFIVLHILDELFL